MAARHDRRSSLSALIALPPAVAAGLIWLNLIWLVTPSIFADEQADPRIVARDKLWEQAQELEEQKRFKEAASVGETMLALERLAFEADDSDLFESLNWLGATNERGELWEAAEKYRNEALAWAEKHFGADHWETVDAKRRRDFGGKLKAMPAAARAELATAHDLYGQSLDLRIATKFGEAVDPSRRAYEIHRRLLGDKHRDTITALQGLAYALDGKGDFAEAKSRYAEVVELTRAALGDKHPEYATALIDLARAESASLNYPRSRELFERGAAIRAAVFGEDDVDYAASLRELARLCQASGDFARASAEYAKAIAIYRQALGDDDAEVANCLDGMATNAVEAGNYAQAEPLFRESLRITMILHGETSLEYAGALNNVATLYRGTGDLVQAERVQRQSKELFAKLVGDKHPYYAIAAANLALIYQLSHDFVRAEPLYLAAMEIRRVEFGERHPTTALSQLNLASLYDEQGQSAKAEDLYKQSSAAYLAAFGERNIAYALSLNNLGDHYSRVGRHAEALDHFRRALEIRKALLGETHPDYALSLNNVAFQYCDVADFDSAAPLFREGLKITRNLLEATSVVQSERQQLTMGQSLRYRLDGFVSLAVNGKKFDRDAFEEVLAWKGATLVRQRGMRLAAADPAVAELFLRLQEEATRGLAAAGRSPPEDADRQPAWREQITKLTAEKELLEAELSRRSAAFRQAVRNTVPRELIAALPADAALVDFLEYWRTVPDPAKLKPATMTREFVAFVVRPAQAEADQIRLIALGAAPPIAQAIDVWRESFGMSPQGVQAGASLRKAIWEPLLPALGDAQTILVATDGALGRLPLGALPGREPGKYLIEDHRLATIPVPQLLPALIHEEGKRELSRELLLLGDVDYEAAADGAASPTTKKKRPTRPGDDRSTSTPANSFAGTDRAPAGDVVFERLANTAGEIATIRELYGRLFEIRGDDPRALAQAEATEQSFRKFAGEYRHLHLATHGFFAAADFSSALGRRSPAGEPSGGDRSALVQRDSPVVGFNPGLLSGLALAGANREPADQADDGILTSQEIAFLPLAGVDTVVLSACDTGLGDTAGGEGLLGVQRAFQVAGARTTVASYWKVDDLVTRLLMERFYRNLWEREMPRLDALREAELYILNHPESLRGVDPVAEEPTVRTSPRYWAAFGLSGDWR